VTVIRSGATRRLTPTSTYAQCGCHFRRSYVLVTYGREFRRSYVLHPYKMVRDHRVEGMAIEGNAVDDLLVEGEGLEGLIEEALAKGS
jgi:hypothetical protein